MFTISIKRFSSKTLKVYFSILSIFICFNLNAQIAISGIVIDFQTKKPINEASVFINNATKGTITKDNGKFVLNNLSPGVYELVVSIVGYETFVQSVTVSNSIAALLFELHPKIVKLREVVILTKVLRERYLSIFIRNFIGTSENSRLCKIINPDIIDFNYDRTRDMLYATTDDFLLIENKALGYRIKFLLNQFSIEKMNGFGGITFFEGSAFFEELRGRYNQQKRWLENRTKAYLGSNMHFLRSASAGRIKEQGFVMHILLRKPNENRPPEDRIQSRLEYFSRSKAGTSGFDSLAYWQRKESLPKLIQYLSKDTLSEISFIKRTDQPGTYALSFKDFVFVVYHAKAGNNLFSSESIINTSNAPYSVMQLQQEYVFFDTKGIIINPQSLIFEGYWGEHGKIADLLPTDYSEYFVDVKQGNFFIKRRSFDIHQQQY